MAEALVDMTKVTTPKFDVAALGDGRIQGNNDFAEVVMKQ